MINEKNEGLSQSDGGDDESFREMVEASRAANELLSYGPNAHLYAARLASEALAKGNLDEHRFWNLVFAGLQPRETSN